MVLNAAIISVMVLSLYAIWKLRQMKKHDMVLYSFCQIRREIMAMLRQENFNMKKKDYFVLRNLLYFVNKTIHNYNSLKPYAFNFRKFIKYARSFKTTTEEVEKLMGTDNPKIKAIRIKMAYALVRAFFVYTPFISSTIFLHILVYSIQKIPTICEKCLDASAEGTLEFVSWLKREYEKTQYYKNNNLASDH